jgi:hypothetical protein
LSEKLGKPLTNTIKRIPNKWNGFDFRWKSIFKN